MKKILAVAALSVLTTPVWAIPTTVTLSVPTMDCPVCPITVKKALTKVPGVSQAEIDFGKRLATVTFESSKTNADALVKATTDAGYPSTLVEHTK
ncbi:mercury resistance system periplasmic binding protein MerP [Castellaniella sp. FW104-16D08]|uniref:mercury resistance system periplasmic binding protein MerP n=1 Tax=unclassified Castellaniella TaxID=2617606 RepID=UPI0033151F73